MRYIRLQYYYDFIVNIHFGWLLPLISMLPWLRRRMKMGKLDKKKCRENYGLNLARSAPSEIVSNDDIGEWELKGASLINKMQRKLQFELARSASSEIGRNDNVEE